MRARWTSRSRKSAAAPVEQLDQRAGDLDAGGAAADDHEGQRALVDERRVGVGRLEQAEHVVAQADRVAQAVEGEAVPSAPSMPKVLVAAPAATIR